MKRHEWIRKYPDREQRCHLADQHPLAAVLEYQPKILVPGKGLILYEPWDFQQNILRDRSRNRAAVKGRQQGLTTTFSIEAAWKLAKRPGSFILIVSKNIEAAEEFLARLARAYFSFKAVDPSFPEPNEPSKRVFRVSNESVAMAVPATPRTGRVYTASDWYFDECAHTSFAQEIFDGAAPTTAAVSGTITLFSTPYGRGNLFHRAFDPREKMGFNRHSYEWWWSPLYNPAYAEFKAAFDAADEVGVARAIEKAKRGRWYRQERPKYSSLVWAREFECDFDAGEDTVFDDKQLDRTFRKAYLPRVEDPDGICTEWYRERAATGRQYATGVDLGRKRDATVLVTYDVTERPARVVEFKYVEGGTSDWDSIERTIRQTAEEYRSDMLIESNGPGDPLQERLADVAHPYQMTANQHTRSKQNLIENLRTAMDKGAIRIPRLPHLFVEHQRYRWNDKRQRQDCVMANAIAVYAFYEPESETVGVDPDFSLTEDIDDPQPTDQEVR